MKIHNLLVLFIFSCISLFIACDNAITIPRPKGQIRLTVPPSQYISFDTTYPYTFEYPNICKIIVDTNTLSEPFWINILYPTYQASIYISYKKVNNNLDKYLEDQRVFVNKHIPKANAIDNKIFINETQKVYGMTYEIYGSEAASPFQFYVTDSTKHFLRASLYFNIKPNNDSLAPIITSIKEDMEHLINTLKWK